MSGLVVIVVHRFIYPSSLPSGVQMSYQVAGGSLLDLYRYESQLGRRPGSYDVTYRFRLVLKLRFYLRKPRQRSPRASVVAVPSCRNRCNVSMRCDTCRDLPIEVVRRWTMRRSCSPTGISRMSSGVNRCLGGAALTSSEYGRRLSPKTVASRLRSH
jgi:hypothetical protein